MPVVDGGAVAVMREATSFYASVTRDSNFARPRAKKPHQYFYGVCMRKNDVTCSACGAGFRRLELATPPANKGEYRCPACDEVLETFDGSAYIAYRMTIQPSMKAARQ